MFKWLYNLGVENERRRIRDGLMLRIGNRPELEDFPNWNFGSETERKEHFQKELDAWRIAQDMVSGYFYPPAPELYQPDPGVNIND